MISTDLQLRLVSNAAEKIVGDLQPLFEIKRREFDSFSLGSRAPTHSTITTEEQALIGLRLKNGGSEKVLHAARATPRSRSASKQPMTVGFLSLRPS